jgi:hypothetical protein
MTDLKKIVNFIIFMLSISAHYKWTQNTPKVIDLNDGPNRDIP